MSLTGSVSQWLDRLQAGDHAAAQQLWERYFHRLMKLARAKLHGRARRVADEEDVALSAFDSFCQGAEHGRFPQLLDRDNLWRLLVVITERKALRLVEHEGRQKRGRGRVLDEAALESPAGASFEETGLEGIVGREPTPEFAAQVVEECRHLLALLEDRELESVALWKMEGYSNADIATRLNCAPRTVERKLRLIRTIWEKESAS
ncbi:MAG: ECF-type sigma factor [Gemmataceae bacterium]|nr:ECF-type sigma factor [Gemmataceae bacterium]